MGGTFTNFETISKRINYFKDLENKESRGDFEKYTKKERMQFSEEIESLKNKFGGIKNMNSIPEAVLVMDIKKDATCVREARKKGIQVIGVIDTNVDPTLANYPIPANDDAISSISYILEKIKEVSLNSKI